MAVPVRRVVALVAALLLVAGCGGAERVDVVADAGDTAAPPRDARLADVGYAGTAAWIRDEVAATGRPVVVKFFASWCGPCAAEAPVLVEAAVDHPEVAFLGVAHQDPLDAARDWVAAHGVDTIPTVLDLEGEVARALGARGMPAVAFVDADGLLAQTHTGPIDPPLLEAWIDHLAHDGPRPSPRPDAPADDTPP
jgi:thiol-disulfide isomerase/thioredoxin